MQQFTRLQRINQHEAQRLIAERTSFVTASGSLTGVMQPSAVNYGELPVGFRLQAHDAVKATDFYVIYSYQTPIAWFADGQWNIPDVKYSATTAKHQAIVRRAIA